MSRELKFRAWVKPLKRYANGIDTILYHKACDVEGGGIWSAICEEWDSEVYECDNIVIEQYTGLKDKNGKDIYEGDIMAQTLVDDPFSKKYPNYVVRWDEKFLSWVLKDVSGDDGNDTDLHFFIEEWKKCEVIGNIHENPDLLEGK